MQEIIIEEKLSNGVRVVIDQGSQAGLVSIGFAFAVGSRHETKEENGLAHFLEHNIFNGTTQSTAEEIALRAAEMGTTFNAYTAKTETNYHITGQAADTERMMDILTEIVCDSTFPEEDFETERGAVIQEIGQRNGTPDILFFDKISSVLYPDQAFGRTVIGPVENVSAVPRETMIQFFKDNYNTGSLIVSVAGDIDPANTIQKLEERLSRLRVGMAPAFEKARLTDSTYDHLPAPYMPQTRASLLYPGMTILNPDFMALRLGAHILGGGFTSPLYKTVRKQNGLAYSIYSDAYAGIDSGSFEIAFSTTPETMGKTMAVIKDTLNNAVKDFSESDLRRAKVVFHTGPKFGSEKVSDRMLNAVSHIASRGYVNTLQKHLGEVECATLKEVKEAVEKIISQKPTMVTMGPEEASSAFHKFTLGLG